jgi:hypothetical protein
MKHWLLRPVVFLLTLSTGLLFGWILFGSSNYVTRHKETEFNQPTSSTSTIRCNDVSPFEFTDLAGEIHYFDSPDFPDNFIDLYNTESVLRKSEAAPRHGQKWFVMTEKNGKYEIKSSVVKVKQLATVSYVGDENDAKLIFDVTDNPLFAFRGIKNIKPGPVKTLYLRPTNAEIETRGLPIGPMETGYSQDFNLNDQWTTLRVSEGQTTSGNRIGLLVLERPDHRLKQIVARNYFEGGKTIIGTLYWAGDLDNDGKLDLYFDEFNEKAFWGRLYLSSHASDGEMLKLVATFGFGGC